MSDSPQTVPDMAAVYRALRSGLLGFLRKSTGDAQLAEDLLQDVMVKALQRAEREEDAPDNLTGWLYAVARNAAIDHFRRARPGEPLPEDLAAEPPDEEGAAAQTLAQCLRPMAERLPDTYRATVVAAEFEGLRLADIAQADGVSLSAVKSRASRGRKLLREELVNCCRVELSRAGQVVDFDARNARACEPDNPSGACATGICRN